MNCPDTLPHVSSEGFEEAASLHGVDHADLESFCDRYGHGECYALAVALADRHGWTLRMFVDSDDDPIHVAALTPDGILVDAYGAFSDAKVMVSRWPEMEKATWRDTNREEIDDIWDMSEEDLEDAVAMLDEPWMSLVVQSIPAGAPRVSP